MGNNLDETFMQRAWALAAQAESIGEVPVGAVIVRAGEVIAEAFNQPIRTHDASAHAEILAIRAAGERLSNYRLPECTLYVTLEPCPMCAAALVHARIARVVFGAFDPKTGAAGSVYQLLDDNRANHRVRVAGGVLESECAEQLRAFFRKRR